MALQDISLGEGSGYVTSEHMTKTATDRMKPQSDSTRPRRRHAIKKGKEGCCICRTRSVLPFRSCWNFRGIPAAAGCVPIVDCPAMVGWLAMAIGWVGWSVGQHQSCSFAAITKAGLVMKANVPSSRLEVRGGLAMELGVSMGLSWWAWSRWDCPDPLPRWCAVQSLEWRTAAAMRRSSWSSTAQCKPDFVICKEIFCWDGRKNLDRVRPGK